MRSGKWLKVIMTTELGRLERADPRLVWPNEASHFTPWLGREENLALLGDAIGIDLELEAQEQYVGPFRADILCKDTVNGNWVLIENQLARTDHGHLGQLITYAAGLQAVTIVWIATPFTEEHRAALDWLNQITDERFNFFGLEVELWRIGNSPFAPKFNIVSKPNDWSKTVSAGAARVERGNLTGTKELQLRFWTYFSDYVKGRQTVIRTTKPLPQHWMNISLGRSGFKLNAIASTWDSQAESFETNELRVEFEINKDSERYYQLFFAEKEQIEAELGYEVTWYNMPNKISKRVYTKRSVNLSDESDWKNQAAWMLERLEEFYRVFAPRVRNL